MRTLLYRFCRGICRLIFIPCRFRVLGLPETLPEGCILAGNHISHFDPPAVGVIWSPVIDFMAMQDLFSRRWSAWLFDRIYAIPVDREGSGLKALREALVRVKAGRTVCVFPEGGLRSGEASILHPGVACPPGAVVLAQKTGAPIYPFIILGTDQLYAWQNWFRRPEIRIEFFPPIEPHFDGAVKSREILLAELDAVFKKGYQSWRGGGDYRRELESLSAAERWAEWGRRQNLS